MARRFLHLPQSGVDCSVIALWLGHESLETTHVYVEADLLTKEKALTKLKPPGTPVRRFKPDDALLAFLASLGLCRAALPHGQDLHRRARGRHHCPAPHNPALDMNAGIDRGGRDRSSRARRHIGMEQIRCLRLVTEAFVRATWPAV